MMLKNTSHSINDYIRKPQRDSAPKLQRLFNKNNAPFRIPTAYELILDRLQFYKYCAIEYGDFCDNIDEDAEIQELCSVINVDWQDIDASVVAERWKAKRSVGA